MFTHDRAAAVQPEYAAMLDRLSQLPGGSNWLQSHLSRMQDLRANAEHQAAADLNQPSNAVVLTNLLDRLGVPPLSVTNTN